jgi:hypothetical protein
VEVACRSGAQGRVVVVTNLTAAAQEVVLQDACEDLFARTIITDTIELAPYGVRVLRTTG